MTIGRDNDQHIEGAKSAFMPQVAPATLIDTDKILARALQTLQRAVIQWRQGGLLTEEPLISSLVRNYRRSRNWPCSAFSNDPVSVDSSILITHRRGDNNQDLYGSDLVSTLLIVGDQDYSFKTVLIQAKIVEEGGHAQLRRDQLEASQNDPDVRHRSFVLATDARTEASRVSASGRQLGLFGVGRDTHRVYPFADEEWSAFSCWLEQWLHCSVGVASDLAACPLEKRLIEKFRHEDPSVEFIELELERARARFDMRRDYATRINHERDGSDENSLRNIAGWIFQKIEVSRPLKRD